MLIKINYNISNFNNFRYGINHFKVAISRQENLQDLFNQKVILTNPNLENIHLSFSERLIHLAFSLEFIPIFGHVLLLIEKYFNRMGTQFSPSVSSSSSAQLASPPSVLFGQVPSHDHRLNGLVTRLKGLPPMDKVTMSGRCEPQTDRMEGFLKQYFSMENIEAYIVDGVRSFRLERPIATYPDNTIISFGTGQRAFQMSVGEIKEWQDSYRVFYDLEKVDGNFLERALQGGAKSGQEASQMKFVARIAKTPIFTEFDGQVISRRQGEPIGEIYQASVCGVDFAGRQHDVNDITDYIPNANEVYQTNTAGNFVIRNGRDFVPTGVKPILNEQKLFQDLKRMTLLRLSAQDRMGIEVVVETGLGLGVFSGDRIGIGNRVRELSALALKEVMEENAFANIKLICCAMPIFNRVDNYHTFERIFQNYKGNAPLMLLDQDMHKIARTAALEVDQRGQFKNGFRTCELNPGDSHGVYGEYWQNRGPGTEEKLALTSAGLLTQHHLINPNVLDRRRYQGITL